MVRIVAMVLFGLPVTFAIAMEKTVTSFLPFRLPCFAFWSRQDTVSLRWVKSGKQFSWVCAEPKRP